MREHQNSKNKLKEKRQTLKEESKIPELINESEELSSTDEEEKEYRQ